MQTQTRQQRLDSSPQQATALDSWLVQTNNDLVGPRSRICFEVLQDVQDAFAGVISSAQAIDWKLPSYSRSRRYIHEIERNALRGGELVKRLLRELNQANAIACVGDAEAPPEVSATAAAQGQGVRSRLRDGFAGCEPEIRVPAPPLREAE